MATGLVRRGGRYSVRRRVPKDLVEVLGRQEVTKALGTANREEAKRLQARQWLKWDEEFDALRASKAAGQECAETAARRDAGLSGFSVSGVTISPTAVALVDLDTLRDRRAEAYRSGRLSDFNRECQEALALYQAMLDGLVAPDKDDLRVVEGKRNGLRAFLSGEGAMGLAVKRRTLVPVSEADNQLRSLTATTWEKLVAKWAAERKPTTKSRKAHEAVAKAFDEAVGYVPLEQLTKRHGLVFKDALVDQKLTAANIRTKLSRLKTLANFGYDNDLIGARILEGIRPPREKSVGRVKYSDEALERLFSGPVHQTGERPTRGRGEAAYWLPLIAAYSGARLEEIAGLRVADVVHLDLGDGGEPSRGWFFRFVPDKDAGRRLKTVQSERETPVHPELIRLGLIQYAESLAVLGETQLFPRLTQQASGQRANKWGEWFTSYRRERGVTDDRVDFHSFRHTFKDAARAADIPEGLQRQMMGHEGKDVADSYGSGFSRRKATEAIGRLRLPGMPPIPPPR